MQSFEHNPCSLYGDYPPSNIAEVAEWQLLDILPPDLAPNVRDPIRVMDPMR